MFLIAGEFIVKAEFRDELMLMSRELIQPSRNEDGCISYSFYEDQTKPNHFLFFERWKDRESIDAHFQKNYFKVFAERFPDMIEGKGEINIYEIKHTEMI